jgi:hypothetical protein
MATAESCVNLLTDMKLLFILDGMAVVGTAVWYAIAVHSVTVNLEF